MSLLPWICPACSFQVVACWCSSKVIYPGKLFMKRFHLWPRNFTPLGLFSRMCGVEVYGWRLCFGSCAGIRHVQGKQHSNFRTNFKLLLGSRRWRECHGEEGSLLQLSILASGAVSNREIYQAFKKKVEFQFAVWSVLKDLFRLRFPVIYGHINIFKVFDV